MGAPITVIFDEPREQQVRLFDLIRRDGLLEAGVDRFAKRCLASVFRYTNEWEHLTERIGFWVDLDNAYMRPVRDPLKNLVTVASDRAVRGCPLRAARAPPAPGPA